MTAEQLVLVGGLWLDAAAWDEVVADLTGRGRDVVAVRLPVHAGATLTDQAAAVLAAVDAAPGRSVVVGHSAASTLAWLAADARPDRVATVAMIGGWPRAGGQTYGDFFAIKDGEMPFPGWAEFEADAADLDAAARAAFTAAAVAVPEHVATGVITYTDERRYDVPVVLICPEFTPEQAREWLAAGDLPELTPVKHLDTVDIDSGHWPMLTRPAELAGIIAAL
ncbi:alpha/beta fold hydrolase [Actinoplanes palleronii]|nr:alpha/beta hydrolase [Actinoplanes palleronii]